MEVVERANMEGLAMFLWRMLERRSVMIRGKEDDVDQPRLLSGPAG